MQILLVNDGSDETRVGYMKRTQDPPPLDRPDAAVKEARTSVELREILGVLASAITDLHGRLNPPSNPSKKTMEELEDEYHPIPTDKDPLDAETQAPEALRSEIDSTRQRMDETIDALSSHLKGRHLASEVIGLFRSATAEGTTSEGTAETEGALQAQRDDADVVLVSREFEETLSVLAGAIADLQQQLRTAKPVSTGSADYLVKGGKEVLTATKVEDLASLLGSHVDPVGIRAHSGNLDAMKVAELFGLGREQIAQIVGVRRQAFDKTTESVNYQDRLEVLESIAEVMGMVGGTPQTLRAWLRKPNRRLGEVKPLDLILEGRAEAVRKLVTQMTTGEAS